VFGQLCALSCDADANRGFASLEDLQAELQRAEVERQRAEEERHRAEEERQRAEERAERAEERAEAAEALKARHPRKLKLLRHHCSIISLSPIIEV